LKNPKVSGERSALFQVSEKHLVSQDSSIISV